MTFAVYNSKGGVGKTTCAVNLACVAAASGLKILLWDLDPQGAASFFLQRQGGLDHSPRKLVSGKKDWLKEVRETSIENLSLIPSDEELRHWDLLLEGERHSKKVLAEGLAPLKERFDVIFLDCPPGLTLLSENLFRAANVLLVPVVPTALSLRTLEQIRTFFAQEERDGTQLKPFFSMVDRRRKTHRTLQENPPSGFLTSAVPLLSEIEKMGTTLVPAVVASGGKARGIFGGLWAEIAAFYETEVRASR